MMQETCDIFFSYVIPYILLTNRMSKLLYMLSVAEAWSSSDKNAILYGVFLWFCGWHHVFTQ